MDTVVLVLVFIGWFIMFTGLALVHIVMVPRDIRNSFKRTEDTSSCAAINPDKEKDPQPNRES